MHEAESRELAVGRQDNSLAALNMSAGVQRPLLEPRGVWGSHYQLHRSSRPRGCAPEPAPSRQLPHIEWADGL